MREVLGELKQWWDAGQTTAMATVVATFRSAPRPPGASMLVGPDGTAVGSVSGGCVEGAVYDLAGAVVASDQPVLERYGVSDDDAMAVGLVCGGMLDVFVEPISPATFPEFGDVVGLVEAESPVAVATVIEHPDPLMIGQRLIATPEELVGAGGRMSSRMRDAIADDARGLLDHGSNSILHYGPDGERRGETMSVFVWSFAPKPRLIVFGAIDFAAAVAEVGSFLGYKVTVCDARGVFATANRFPRADEVVVDWPHRYLAAEAEAGRIDQRTVLTVLTHDPKFDVPVLEVALRLPVAFVGAMGSRRTHEDRIRRLREVGLSDDDLARLSSPIGLDLGARTPQETAISIAAEIVASRWGGSGEQLSTIRGRIHRG